MHGATRGHGLGDELGGGFDPWPLLPVKALEQAGGGAEVAAPG